MKAYKKRIIYTIVVSLIVVFSSTFAILMTLERNDYRNYLQGEYSKSMYELIDSVQNLRTNLSKTGIINSKEQSIMAFEEIFRYSSIANEKLHSLPIGMESVEITSKFLSQVGDFCYSLARNISEGIELSDEDYEKIDLLQIEAYDLESRLNRALNEINQGKVKWGEIRKKTSGVLAKNDNIENITNKFTNIQKQIIQYPALIYDGPFSDNVVEIEPKVNSMKIVTKSQAKNIVETLFNNEDISKIEQTSENTGTNLESYTFNIKTKKDDNVVCEVTKHGGKILYLLNSRSVGKPKINVEKANNIGIDYLKKLGYKNMISTYTLKYNNIAVINYVYKQGNIVMYPDQIKLKIALDDGEIIGVESQKYLISHVDNREIAPAKISREEALKKVSKRLEVNKINLAIIPTETNKEVLCYEIAGKYKNNDFIVYINAQNGYEQRIIQIIDTPNGQLTI